MGTCTSEIIHWLSLLCYLCRFATRFTWIYLLKAKSDTLAVFKQFKAYTELDFGFPIKALQTDSSGEFRRLTNYLTDLGIVHRLICPHTNHQNSVMWRKHRHIVNLDLTLLSQVNFPLNFLDHNFTTAVFQINRLTTVSLGQVTPYNALFGQNPDYKFLKVFGCACFLLKTL